MDLRIFLRALWSNALAIGIAALLTGAAVFAITASMTPTYEASARLIVDSGLGQGGASTDDVLSAPRIGATYAALAATRPVLQDVITRAGLTEDPEQLAKAIEVTASLDVPIVDITMSDPDPERAAAAANAMAAALVELATDKSVPGAPKALLSTIESASVPEDAVFPRPLFSAVLSIIVVLVAAVVLLASLLYLRGDRGTFDT